MKGFQKRLLITNLVFAIIPFMLVSMVLFYSFVRSVREKLDNSILSNVEYSAKTLEWRVATIDKYFNFILTNNRLQQILIEESLNAENENIYILMDELSKFFNAIFYKDNFINSCILFSEKGGSFSNSNRNSFNVEDIKKSSWYKDVLNGEGKAVWADKVYDNEITYDNKFNYLVGSVIKDVYYRTGKTSIIGIGTIIFLLKRDFFSGIFSSPSENNQEINVVLDTHGNVLYSNAKNADDFEMYWEYVWKSNHTSGMSGFKLDKEYTTLYYCKIETNGWTVLKIYPKDSLIGKNNSFNYFLLLSILPCISLLYMISSYMSRKFSLPIVNIADAMKRVGKSDFSVSVDENALDEIGTISRGFNAMVKEIGALFNKVVNEEREKQKAQIRALKYQINPHFIYNTLSGIRLLAFKEGNEEAAEILKCFGRLLRDTLSRTGALIPVKEEVDNVKNYIRLQQMQYRNRLDFEIDIDENILDYYIPCMILQPVIENSITHGLVDKLNSGIAEAIIIVRGFVVDDRTICLGVWDNGCGIAKHRIEGLFCEQDENMQDENGQDESGHIGIQNIRQRIKLEFGEQYDIVIESECEEYTLVSITLPIIKEVTQC